MQVADSFGDVTADILCGSDGCAFALVVLDDDADLRVAALRNGHFGIHLLSGFSLSFGYLRTIGSDGVGQFAFQRLSVLRRCRHRERYHSRCALTFKRQLEVGGSHRCTLNGLCDVHVDEEGVVGYVHHLRGLDAADGIADLVELALHAGCNVAEIELLRARVEGHGGRIGRDVLQSEIAQRVERCVGRIYYI